MDDPSIQVDGLRRTFGAVTALDGVDVCVGGPSIVGVAGPNGSGKTTLIETLLGLLAPTDGSVQVNGVDPLAFGADDRRRLGYMPQHEAVYDDLTVRENVAFFARLYGSKTAGARSIPPSTSSTSPTGPTPGSPSFPAG